MEFFYRLRRRSHHRVGGARMVPNSKKRSKIATLTSYFDFENVAYISPGAALVLAADQDRLARLNGSRPSTINVQKWDPYVATLLSRLGFLEILRLPDYDKAPPADAVLVERMVSQGNADASPGTASIRRLFDQIGGSNGLRVDLGSAVTDAIENVVSHAYPESWEERPMRVPFWWFVGAADPKQSRITMIIYDQGITIPASLPLRWSPRDLIAACQNLFGVDYRKEADFDGRAIDAATAIGATSTDDPHRGKGLAKIRDLVTKCPDGRLRIISRHGECLYQAGSAPVVRALPIPLLGTYIELDASFA